MRPESVTEQDIARWEKIMASDPFTAKLMGIVIVKEVCFAGQWMSEALQAEQCPEDLIVRIAYTHGRMCFGQKDPWAIASNILENYKAGTLEFELDSDSVN